MLLLTAVARAGARFNPRTRAFEEGDGGGDAADAMRLLGPGFSLKQLAFAGQAYSARPLTHKPLLSRCGGGGVSSAAACVATECPKALRLFAPCFLLASLSDEPLLLMMSPRISRPSPSPSSLDVAAPGAEGPKKLPLTVSALGALSAAGVRWVSTWRCGDLGRLSPEDALDLAAMAFALRAADMGADAVMQVGD